MNRRFFPKTLADRACAPLATTAALSLALLLTACGRKTDDAQAHSGNATAAATDSTTGRLTGAAQARAFYAEHPEFFHFKTPEDIPENLAWEDGSELPEIGSPAAKKGGTFNTWMQDFPRTLRTVGPDSNGSFRGWILDNVTLGYAHRHPNVTELREDGFHYLPALADRWALDRETKTVYIHLNSDAKWNDGQPITTDDALFSFFFYRSPHIRAPWYNNFYGTKYAGITRFDEHTFALHFHALRPDIYSLALGLSPTPAHFYAEFGEDFTERYQWRVAPTTGPYTIARDADIAKGRSITLTRVKDWWARDLKHFRYRFNPDRIRISVIRDSAKAFEAFRKGDLDTYGLGLAEDWYDKLPDSAPEVAKGYIQKIKFYNDTPRPTYGLWMNEATPLLANRDIRLGVQHATNWQLVIDKFSRGDWSRMQTTADGYGDFTHPTLRSRDYDIDQALAHFAAAGFARRGPDGILVNADGQRLSLQLTTGYEHFKDMLTILQEEAIKAGLDLRIEILDGTAAWKKAQEKKHEILFAAFNVGAEMFPRYWETYHSVNAYDAPFIEAADGSLAPNPARKPKPQSNNLQSIADPQIDAMIDAYDRSDDLAEMRDLAYRLEEALYADASFSPGFVTPFLRHGAWRWLRFPEDGNVKIANSFEAPLLFWIEPELKKETLDARKTGKAFEPQILIFDQYKKD